MDPASTPPSKEQSERAPVKSFFKNKGKCFGAKIKRKWEGQFTNPFVLNKPVNLEPCY